MKKLDFKTIKTTLNRAELKSIMPVVARQIKLPNCLVNMWSAALDVIHAETTLKIAFGALKCILDCQKATEYLGIPVFMKHIPVELSCKRTVILFLLTTLVFLSSYPGTAVGQDTTVSAFERKYLSDLNNSSICVREKVFLRLNKRFYQVGDNRSSYRQL